MTYDKVQWQTSLHVNWANSEAGYEWENVTEIFAAAAAGVKEMVTKMTVKETVMINYWNEAGTGYTQPGESIDIYKVPEEIIYVSKTIMSGTVQFSIRFDSGRADSACGGDKTTGLDDMLNSPAGMMLYSVKGFSPFADALFTLNTLFKKCPSNNKFGVLGDDKDAQGYQDLRRDQAVQRQDQGRGGVSWTV
jgi:hypothetical protein